MIIKYDYLVELLIKHLSWSDDTSPREALYIEFPSTHRKVKDTITYHTADSSLVAIDIDEEGRVLGIEIT